MSKVAVIVAGGSGSRMGKEIPKQFLLINNKPILLYTISAFVDAYPDIRIILVLHADYWEYTRQILQESNMHHHIEFVRGGSTRFESVKNGLSSVGDEEIVFVHDAVRCMVSPQLIRKCADAALEHGSAIPVIPVRDSLRKWEMNTGNTHAVSRQDLYIVQTPQTFKTEIILKATQMDDDPSFTDEATVVESMGLSVHLIEGEEKNIKITFPEDLRYAEWMLRE